MIELVCYPKTNATKDHLKHMHKNKQVGMFILNVSPASGSPSFHKKNVLIFSWSRMAILVGVLTYILSTCYEETETKKKYQSLGTKLLKMKIKSQVNTHFRLKC